MNVAINKFSESDYEQAREILILENVDEALLTAINNKENNLYTISNNNHYVGVLQLNEREKSFLYIFIFPLYRRNGIGTQVVQLCEKKLKIVNANQIMTTYRSTDIEAKHFANKRGYVRQFSSECMKYSGSKFEITELPVRGYCNKDYSAAHEMYARAFHEMRVRVGDFPNSIIEEPNDNMRNHWAKTSDERFVYIMNNEIVGYAHVEGNEIGSISIKPEMQGKGIGRDFVKYICNKLLDDGKYPIILYCVVGNWAKNLYTSLGFQEVYVSDFAIKYIF